MQRIRIDPNDVIHETLDGEVILIAVTTGAYYSLEGSGADIWAGLLAGRAPALIAEELEGRYEAEAGAVRRAVDDLVARLVAEGLVRHGDGEAAPADPVPAASAPAPGRAPFPPPVLHKFTDMQDFLLLDPIHEVGEAGWPHADAAR